MESKNNISHFGVVWYTKEEWQRMKEISLDTEILENSFKEWKQMANKSLIEIKASGIIAEKVFIKVDEFILWCKIHSLPYDAKSRSNYVSDIMLKRNSN